MSSAGASLCAGPGARQTCAEGFTTTSLHSIILFPPRGFEESTGHGGG
jgi:hypothetical protein